MSPPQRPQAPPGTTSPPPPRGGVGRIIGGNGGSGNDDDGNTSAAGSTADSFFACAGVNELCEYLWCSGGGNDNSGEDPRRLLACLDAICAAVYGGAGRDQQDRYDPSEVFLALQGAALRFPKKPPKRDNNDAVKTAAAAAEGINALAAAAAAAAATNSVDDHQKATTRGGESGEARSPATAVEKEDPKRWDGDDRRRRADSGGGEDEDDDDLPHAVAYRCLLAVAALARVCVGPAWWDQIRRRRESIAVRGGNEEEEKKKKQQRNNHRAGNDDDSSSSSTTSSLQEDAHANSAPSEPVTAAAAEVGRCGGGQQPEPPKPYPTIPEVLPAAMIRFAAGLLRRSAGGGNRDLSRRGSHVVPMVQAQMVLVQSLCCRPAADEGSSDPHHHQSWRAYGNTAIGSTAVAEATTPQSSEWLLPGVQEEMGSMVLSWLSLARSPGGVDIDNDTDFVSDASSPGSADVSLRLAIARACSDLVSEGWYPCEQVCAEMICVLLGVSQSAIKTQLQGVEGGDEMFLISCVATEALSTLTVLARRGLVPCSTVPSIVTTLAKLHGDVVTSGWQREIDETGKTQQQKLFSVYVSEVLWTILSSDSLAIIAIETLVSMITSVVFTSAKTIARSDPSAAGWWGESETTACRQAEAAIRIISSALWGGESPESSCIPLLRAFWAPMLALFFDALSANFSLAQQIRGEVEAAANDICRLACESFAALGRSIKSEIRGGKARFSEMEWEVVINSLEGSVLPWLVDHELWPCTSTQAESLVVLIGDFLDYATCFERVPFVEYELLEKLYLILLRQISPHLGDEHARQLGTFTIKSWAMFGFFPHRLSGGSETASCLLNEAFRRIGSGDYAHDAAVRLNALKAMTFESVKEYRASRNEIEHAPSLLELTQHMREQHLEFIGCCILPILQEILMDDSAESSSETMEDIKFAAEKFLPPTDAAGSFPKAFAKFLGNKVQILLSNSRSPTTTSLGLYSIQLTGRLYRAASGLREYRALLVGMLHSVALNERFRVDSIPVSGKPPKLSHSFPIRIAAIMELGRCLEASFVSLPHTHESVPRIIDALCGVVDEYSEIEGVSEENDLSVALSAVLAAAALDPISRLRVAIDRHVAFRAREVIAQDISDVLFSFYSSAMSDYRSAVVETSGNPFLEVDENDDCCSVASTPVSFQGIIFSVLKYLQVSRSLSAKRLSALSFTRKCMRIHCFDVLRHHFLASIPVQISEATARVVFTSSGCQEEPDIDENLARSHALVKCAENEVMLLRCKEKHPDSNDLLYLDFMVGLVVDVYQSSYVPVRDVGCRAITSILPSLLYLDRKHKTCTLSQVLSSLGRMLDSAGISLLSNSCRSLLTVLVDVLLIISSAEMPDGLISKLFVICTDVVMARSCPFDSFCVELAMRCAAGLLELMNVEGLRDAKQVIYSHSHDVSNNGNKAFLAISRLADLVECRRSADGPPCYELNSYNIDDFQSGHSCTWLIDDSNILLTCKLGATATRFEGYLEVITRSLAERRRSLIRIPGKVSLEHPDLPPLLPKTNESQPPASSPSAAETAKKFDTSLMTDSCEHPARQSELTPGHGKPTCCDNRGVSVWLKTVCELHSRALSVVEERVIAFLSSAIGAPQAACLRLVTLQQSEQMKRAVTILDRTPTSSTHKIALLYDSSSQPNDSKADVEARLLMTTRFSPSFYRFATRLGSAVPTRTLCFTGGLDKRGSDGQYTLRWSDCDKKNATAAATNSIVYHVVSLMPAGFPASLVRRKSHVGNDYVVILFADKGSDAIVEFDLRGGDLLGGAFGFVVIFVTIPRAGIYRVNIRVREDRIDDDLLKATLRTFVGDKSLPEEDAPAFVRAIAMRADLACRTGIGAADANSNYLYRSELLEGMRRFAFQSS